MSTIRTSAHDYPREEINAMTEFYKGNICIITKLTHNVQWAHIMDPALPASNENLSRMLDRKLREDRHPRHAAEVRENIVPVNVHHHLAMDKKAPLSTLFLHEDILARTFSYERDLQDWRLAELGAGRPDPGRPSYVEVFGGYRETEHRYHCSDRLDGFLRTEGDTLVTYTSQNCPGIDVNSQRPFPIINTLLSIPFSVLHNLPRLGAMAPHSKHQYALLMMATKIVQLWWWDPPNMTPPVPPFSMKNATKPHPINHPSRLSITFERIQPVPFFPNHRYLMVAEPAIECLGRPTHHWDETLPTKDDLEPVDISLMAGITGSLVTSEAWTETEDEDKINDVQDKSVICPSPFDIALWSQKTVESRPEPLPLTHTSFERGVIASMTVNDILMVKGLINPAVYIQFLDLGSFSSV